MLIKLSAWSCLEFRMQEEFTEYRLIIVARNGGTALENLNSIQEKIKSRLKSGNAWYYLVQNLLSSTFISKNTKTKI